ncbi:hypothetical protein MWN34_09750 [Ancylobacter sp. 6x-1]|uniref:Cellulose synthase n=1 Tax=Ancylobacter crimeensis TaxID=2579147 RepID=A0ABT0DB82_9HYPH|nr:hypothetical protein [Ancylobacter crimeensis]MCK0197195.1 hypothetical protein [Ancylobacter crimeensis]
MSLNRALLLVLLGTAVVPAIAQQIELPGSKSADKQDTPKPETSGAAQAAGTTPAPPAGNPAPTSPGAGTPASGTNAAVKAGPKVTVDESALRYFASQGDTRRMDAEIARLRALYPDWNPPSDLYAPIAQSDAELENMWRLFGEGKYSDVRSAIAARQASQTGWTPPADLLARLDEAEARRRLVNASDAQQWATVLRVATDTPALLTCASVDVIWRVAEAFVKTSQPDRAQDAYTYVLNNCTNSAERVATIQKAMGTLDDKRIDQLMTLERKNPDSVGEFKALREEMLRRKVGQAALDSKTLISQDELTAMGELARAAKGAGDPLVLAWYLYRHDQQAAALEWFKLALDRDGGAKAAEGYVLTMVAQGRAVEAEPIAYQWRDSSPENRKAYLDTVVSLLTTDPPILLDQSVIDHFSPIVLGSKYVSGAQALGWYAYNTGQLPIALTWFQTAVNWAPNDEPSAYGLALTLFRLNETAALNDVVARWRGRSERIMALTDPVLRARLAAEEAAKAAANPQLNQQLQAQQQQLRLIDPVGAAAARARAGLDMNSVGPVNAARAVGAPAPAASRIPAAYGTAPAAVGSQPAASSNVMSYQQNMPAAVGGPAFPAALGTTARAYGTSAVAAQAVPMQTARAPLSAQASGPAVEPAGTSVIVRKGAPEPRVSTTRSRGQVATRSGRGCLANTQNAYRSGRITPGAAVSRGWCLMDLNRPMEAVEAFDLALKNGASGKTAEDAAYGKSLAYMRKNLTNDAQIAATETPQTPRRATQLNVDILAQRAITSYKDDRFVEAIIALDERARLVPEDQGLMMIRGWSYFHLRDMQSADRIFKALAAAGNKDAQAGVFAILDYTRKYRY